jgi:hypothetical protein
VLHADAKTPASEEAGYKKQLFAACADVARAFRPGDFSSAIEDAISMPRRQHLQAT